MAANMYLAYDGLPDRLKQRIAPMTATHRWGWNTGGAAPKLTKEQQETHPDVVHPVVRIHPKTGRKILYVNPGYTMKINDVSQQESDDLLAGTLRACAQPGLSISPQVEPEHVARGSDNRASIHGGGG